jgi:hypothetical protein
MSKKKRKGKKKKPSYTPLSDTLSTDLSLIQASTLLDLAAQQAIQDGDINAMRQTARSWLEVGSVISGISQSMVENEREQTELHSDTRIGFRGPEVDTGDEEGYDSESMLIGFRGRNND